MRLLRRPRECVKPDAGRWFVVALSVVLLATGSSWSPAHVNRPITGTVPTFATTPKPTMMRARPDVEADQVWPLPDAEGHGLTGRGVVICDIDGAVDIFHPMFFYADGGTFSWQDVDGDGNWSPGDAVDMDGDGLVDPGEKLGWLPMTGYYPPGRDTTRFQAGYDFLFQDANENGVRDHGPPAFKEQDPCYGERLFLAADANDNGLLDPDESLVGLKTSKIRAIYDDIIYRRGVDLIEFDGIEDIDHATAVCGILAGGWDKWHHMSGVAPDAELLIAVDWGVESFNWARAESADIVLYEQGGSVSDGSNNFELQIDEAASEGMIFVTAAGNDRLTLQHVTLSGGREQCFMNASPYWISLLFVWRGQLGSSLRMRGPDGSLWTLSPTGDDVTGGGPTLGGRLRETIRGTFFWEVGVSDLRGGVPIGPWHLAFPESPVEIQGYFNRTGRVDSSGWVGDDGRYTVGWPGSADSAITVAAYDNDPIGRIAWFSSSGPRVDGRPDLTIAAPGVGVYATRPGGANFGRFSGTSAAAPFAAGAAALLKQAFPDMDSGLFRSLLTQGAGKDSLTGDTDRWGAGRLRIRQSLVAGLERSAQLAGSSRLPVRASPNPLLAETYLSWQSGVTNDAEVNIYSVDGRLVWNTVSAPSGGRVSSVRWDGRDQRGTMCAEGVYFAQVREGRRVGTARLVLLR